MHHSSRHHRRPKSRFGSGDEFNISRVDEKKHAAWHILFSNWNPEKICRVINDKWLDPEYRFECVKKSDEEVHDERERGQGMLFPDDV